MSQIQEITNINKYLTTANPVCPDALLLKIQWKDYFNTLTWYDKYANINVLEVANNTRNKFNDANTSFSGPSYLTIRQGSTGDNVVQWQKIIGVTADGKFGPNTKAKTIEWQRNNGLTADGVVGPQTWTKALTNPSSASKYEPIAHVPDKPTHSNTTHVFTTPPPVVTLKPKPAYAPTAPSKPGAKYPSGTLHVGSIGPEVIAWQKIIGVKADGKFGPATEAATKAWQGSHGLTVTGYVSASDRAASKVTPKLAPNSIPASVQAAVNTGINTVTAAPAKVIEVTKGLPLWQQITAGIVSLSAVFFGYKAFKKQSLLILVLKMTQTLDQWIAEAASDTEKDGELSMLSLVHAKGISEQEIHTIKLGTGKKWTAKELGSIFKAKAQTYSQELAGVQLFYLLGFYGNRTEPQARRPFRENGQTDLLESMGGTEGPTSTGLTQQAMRHMEMVMQIAAKQTAMAFEAQQSMLSILSQSNNKLQGEVRDASEILMKLMLDRANNQHDHRMKELALERETSERRQLLQLAPALVNTITGKEVFPQETTDSALLNQIAESMDPEKIQTLINSGIIPPQLLGLLSARMEKYLLEKTKKEQQIAKLTNTNINELDS